MKRISILLSLLLFSSVIYGQTLIRLSQIEPIQGTVIKSQGETSGKVLTTNGSNGASWQTPSTWQTPLNGTGYVKMTGTTLNYDNTVAKIINYNDNSIPFISTNYNLSPSSLLYLQDQEYPVVYNGGSFSTPRYYEVSAATTAFFGSAGGVGALISDNIFYDDDAGMYYQHNPTVASSGIQTTRNLPLRVYTTPAGSTTTTTLLRTYTNGNFKIGSNATDTGFKLKVEGTGSFDGTVQGANATLSNEFVTLGQLPTLSNIVTNSGTSTDNYVARFDGTTGKIIQNGRLEITDLGILIPRYQYNSTSFYIGDGAGASDGMFSFSNNNVGVGNYTFNKIAGGDDNTAIGHDALLNLVTNSQNTAIGFRSLRLNTAARNTAIGYASTDKLTTGTENVSAGYNAGSFITDGSTGMSTNNYSIYIGSQSKALSNGLSNEIVIGYNAIGNGSNTVRLGNTSVTGVFTSGFYQGTTAKLTSLTDGYVPYHVSDATGLENSQIFQSGSNVGIGTTSPSEKLEVNGSAKINGTVIGKATQALTETAGAVTWNYVNGSSASVTIDEPTVITLTNVPDGAEGNIYIVQGDSGNDNVTFVHSGLTVKWRGNDNDLTDAAGSYDVVSFWRAGSILFVTLGSDYINQ